MERDDEDNTSTFSIQHCGLCQDEFSDNQDNDPNDMKVPIRGACQHSYCKECVQNLQVARMEMKATRGRHIIYLDCPECRTKKSFRADKMQVDIKLCESLRIIRNLTSELQLSKIKSGTVATTTATATATATAIAITHQKTENTNERGMTRGRYLRSQSVQVAPQVFTSKIELATRKRARETKDSSIVATRPHSKRINNVCPHCSRVFETKGSLDFHIAHVCGEGGSKRIRTQLDNNVDQSNYESDGGSSDQSSYETDECSSDHSNYETDESSNDHSSYEIDEISNHSSYKIDESNSDHGSYETDGSNCNHNDDKQNVGDGRTSPHTSHVEACIMNANLNELRSITAIIKFMDKIEPGRNFYARQKDKRGECSKVRGKLRDYVKKNKHIGNIAVAHYTKNKWAPPTHESLGALIGLLKDMIDKSWPEKSNRNRNDNDNDNKQNVGDGRTSPHTSHVDTCIMNANLNELRSITAIIKFMDKIEPGRNFYARQKDKRGECSKVRKKLRDYVKKNKRIGNIAVAHYTKNKWAPPTHESLGALIRLLKDMIDKSWPEK